MYIGRFAPSPTGPLHIGSLTCALASYLDARAAGGRWLVRIEDLDPPREKPGASGDILRTLEAYGLTWDDDVVYQSHRLALYEQALDQLIASGHAFRCPLSRTQLDAFGANHPGRAFSVTQLPAITHADTSAIDITTDDTGYAMRLDVPDTDIHFSDRIQGERVFNVARTGGPFVIRRRDGLFAYQLAVVIDDATQGITDIVRGSDLLDSTPRQILLQHALGLAPLRYAHIPVLVDIHGGKLSKQDSAAPITRANSLANLRQALRLLGQPDPREAGSSTELLAAAITSWNIGSVPARLSIPAG